MGLSKFPAGMWPTHAAWLNDPNIPMLNRMVVWRALTDIGICEDPLGSNMGKEVENYLVRAGVDASVINAGKGYWCGAAIGMWFIDAGARVPQDYASCDAWLPYLRDMPKVGAAVLYGIPGDARHIELIVRLKPCVLTVGGNKALSGISNDGNVVDMGPQVRKDILGYVYPEQ